QQPAQFELLRSEAQKLGIAVESLDIRKPEDVDAAFDKAQAFGAKGLLNGVSSHHCHRSRALFHCASSHTNRLTQGSDNRGRERDRVEIGSMTVKTTSVACQR